MPNGDAMINSTTTIATTPTTMPSALPPVQPKGPGKFARIFGGLFGGALNVVAPGAGSLIGGLINGGNGMNYANMETMLQQQQHQSMQMLAIQNRVQTNSQEFTTVSNLMKARHDGEMSAVQNFKS